MNSPRITDEMLNLVSKREIANGLIGLDQKLVLARSLLRAGHPRFALQVLDDYISLQETQVYQRTGLRP